MSDTIYIKSPREIELMRQAGKITAGARTIARQAIRDGVTTKQIDKCVHDYIVKCGAKPTFLGYGGFPGSACISVNEELIHGIPGKITQVKYIFNIYLFTRILIYYRLIGLYDLNNTRTYRSVTYYCNLAHKIDLSSLILLFTRPK